MKKVLTVFILFVLILTSCELQLDSIYDPESKSYQGYETVKDLDGIMIVSSVMNPFSIQFLVTPCIEASMYQIQVSSDMNDFSNPQVDSTFSSNSPSISYASLFEGTFYWRTRGISVKGDLGSWSGVRRIDLSNNINGLSPSDGGNTINTTPTFSWNAVAGADHYEIQIAESEVALESASSISISSPEYTPSTGLTNNLRHFWRARAINASSQASLWSDVYTLDISWGSISGMSPSNGVSTNDTTPTFSWNTVTGADHYEFQIAESEVALESASSISISSPEYTPSTGLTNNAKHFWRVRAVDIDSEATLWSDVYTLDISWGSISGMSPSDGESTSDTTPNFSWNTVSGAVGYHIQINEKFDFSGTYIVDDNNCSTESYSIIDELINYKDYHWRIRCKDSESVWGNWSESYTVSIDAIPVENVIDSSFNCGWSVYSADLDGDGDEDILGTPLSRDYGDGITWWKNNGTGSFTKYLIKDDWSLSIKAVDLDGDTDSDIIVGSRTNNLICEKKNRD